MRRFKRITQLEELANHPRLVCPLPYNNPKRKEEIFYDFCKQYGESLGISITEEKFGYLAWKKMQIRLVIEDIACSRGLLLSDLFILLGTPMDFFNVPVIGMTSYCGSKGNDIRIFLPKYGSLYHIYEFLRGESSKAHEYMHAYCRIVANDLLKRSVFQGIDSFFCDVEPISRIPTQEELKAYERKFLAKMIKSEKRWMQRINKS